jgi:hypothetical protein
MIFLGFIRFLVFDDFKTNVELPLVIVNDASFDKREMLYNELEFCVLSWHAKKMLC